MRLMRCARPELTCTVLAWLSCVSTLPCLQLGQTGLDKGDGVDSNLGTKPPNNEIQTKMAQKFCQRS
jgi:hypothetical protein